MIVRYSERTISDLESIHAYLAQRNPQAATRVGLRIKAAIESLADFPGLGRETEHDRGVRILPVGRYPYLIFYRIEEAGGEVVIIHVRHGARQAPQAGEI